MPKNDLVLRHQELIENPAARVPVCLVLDASPSMSTRHEGDDQSAIDQLNIGVARFYQAIGDDEVARYAADIAVVSFSSDARVDYPFGSVDHGAPIIRTRDGGTSLGTAVAMGLALLDRARRSFGKRVSTIINPGSC